MPISPSFRADCPLLSELDTRYQLHLKMNKKLFYSTRWGGWNELETEYMGQDSVHEVKGTEAYTGEKGEEIKKLRECTLQHFIKAL